MAKSSPNHPSKSQPKPTWKPLSIAREKAIDLLILGKSDREVADTVGVNRTTVGAWPSLALARDGHPGTRQGRRLAAAAGTTQVAPVQVRGKPRRGRRGRWHNREIINKSRG